MYQRYKERFGTAGVVLGVIALILALGGSALAAKKYVTKKEAEKIAKKYAGKPGAPGAAGTNGINGTNGKDGAQGIQGEPGDDGAPGANGKSVLTTEITTAGLEGKCEGVGGTKVEVEGNAASKKYICNGEDGQTGFTAHLPPGETETGRWSGFTVYKGQTGPISISYPIPLEEPSEKVVFLNSEETYGEAGTEGCEMEAPEPFEERPAGEPVAPPGTLCVFDLGVEGFGQGEVVNIGETSLPSFGTGDSSTGAVLWAKTSEPNGELLMYGAWAVTAPEAP